MFDVKAMGEQIVATVREYVAGAVDPVIARLKALESLPKPLDEAAINSIVKSAIDAVKDGGMEGDPCESDDDCNPDECTCEDGVCMPTDKSAKRLAQTALKRLDAISSVLPDQAAIEKMVATAVSELPKPRDGEDGKSVDIVALVGEITTAAAKAVAAMPKPADGRDVDPEVVAKMVKEAVDAIPRPQDGKSVTVADLAPVIQAEVKTAVAAIEPIKGEPGRDADPQAIADAVAAQVEIAVKALPAPVDGKDADPDAIRAMVDEAVKALPKPADGKDADVDAITAAVLDRVTKALEDIPAPQNGKDADPAVIAEAVKAEVERAVAQLPTPQDGKSIDPAELAAEIAKAAAAIVQSLTPPPVPADDIKAVVKSVLAEEGDDDAIGEFAAALIAKFAAVEHAA